MFGYTVVYAIARRSWLPLMVQSVILAAVIGLVIWFHGVIPVPAGVVSPGVGP